MFARRSSTDVLLDESLAAARVQQLPPHHIAGGAQRIQVDDSGFVSYLQHHSAEVTFAPTGRKARHQLQRRGGTDMIHCRFAPIDAHIFNVTRSLVSTRLPTHMALHHCPGEGSGGSS